jgi:hypothetical protein
MKPTSAKPAMMLTSARSRSSAILMGQPSQSIQFGSFIISGDRIVEPAVIRPPKKKLYCLVALMPRTSAWPIIYRPPR